MTNHSNPITDILERYTFCFTMLRKKNQKDVLQALYEAVKSCAPKKKTYTEATDTADHWGMTDSSIARQIDNMKGLGHNEAVDEFLANLAALFGVEDDGSMGSSQDLEQPTAQGHEADNSSPLASIPHRDGYTVHVYEDGRIETEEASDV